MRERSARSGAVVCLRLVVLIALVSTRPAPVVAQEPARALTGEAAGGVRLFELTGSCSVTVAPDRAIILGGVAADAMLPLPAIEQLEKQLDAIRELVKQHHGTLALLERVRTVKTPSPSVREPDLPFEVVQRIQATFPANAAVDTVLQRMIEIGLDRFGDAVLATDGSGRQTAVRFRITDLDARLDGLRRRCTTDAWKRWCVSPASGEGCTTEQPSGDLQLQSFSVRSSEKVLRPDGGAGYWEFTFSPMQQRPRPFELLGNVSVHLTGNIILVHRGEEPR